MPHFTKELTREFMGTQVGGGPELMEIAVIMASFQWKTIIQCKIGVGFGLKHVPVHTDCPFIDM